MQRHHCLESALLSLHHFITTIVIGISDNAALAETNHSVSGHCHYLFLTSQSCTSSSGSQLTGTSCEFKHIYTQPGALSYSGDAL